MSDSPPQDLSSNARSQNTPKGAPAYHGLQLTVDLRDELGLDVPDDERRVRVEIVRDRDFSARVDVHGSRYQFEFGSDQSRRAWPVAKYGSGDRFTLGPQEVPRAVARTLDYLGFELVEDEDGNR